MELDIIAEVGSVHDGSFGNACKLVELAKAAGATTIKFQMHLAEHETTRDAPSPTYFSAEPRFDYFRRTAFTIKQWRQLHSLSRELGIELCCSPFSIEALRTLLGIGVGKIKIASGEVTNLPLLKAAASDSEEVLLSSGMSSWAELDEAVDVLRSGSARLTVMQCSSEYPCRPENVGLNVLKEMADRYGCRIGFSDHTLGFAAPIGAVFHGAEAIEKHLTFSRLMYGSDAKNSMEPQEFRQMVVALNEARTIIDNPVNKNDAAAYKSMKEIFQKSLVASSPLKAGTKITENHISFKKPGTGLKPKDLDQVIGKTLRRDVPADHIFTKDDLE